MKTFKKTLGIAACIGMLATSATSVFGAPGAIFTLDEMGNGYSTSGAPLSFTLALDPLSGISTLQYTLPFAGLIGDVLLTDPSNSQLSDVLRFDGNFHVFFFSEAGEGQLADVGLPTTFQANTFTVAETGTEGVSTHASYVPTANQPGYNPSVPGLGYNIISDVPEPSAIILGSLGGGLLLVLRSRRQN